MIYDYLDEFIVNSISNYEIEQYENEAIEQVSKLGIEDDFFIKRLVVSRVYILAARSQFEADGMEAKHKIYTQEYKDALNESLLLKKDGIKNKNKVFSVPLGRG